MSKGEKDERSAIRQRRLVELLNSYKTQQEFADAAGWAGGTYVSLVVSGHKNLGEKLARRTEKKLNLPDGWFDREGDTGPAYKWPFTLTSLDSVRALKPRDLMAIDSGLSAQITALQQADAPRKKPGGGGTGGGSAGSGGGGGDPAGVKGLPGTSTTKHAPVTLVRVTAEQQQIADELALQRAKKPVAAQKLRLVDPEKPASRDLFEK